MVDGSDVGAVVFVIIIALLLIFTPLGTILVDLINGDYNPAPTEYWTANVVASPINAGRVVPSGEKRVVVGETLEIEATALEGWTFNEWKINGTFLSATPTVIIPSQNPNDVLNVEAVFVAFGATFEITPFMQTTVGTSNQAYTYLRLTLTNNGDASINNVKLKLNDPYGVFTKFDIVYDWYYSHGGTGSGSWSSTSANALNSYCGVSFGWYGDDFVLQSHFSKKVNVKFYSVSQNIEAGTYHLSFTIQFVISEGEFNAPPSLTMPWDVTILG